MFLLDLEDAAPRTAKTPLAPSGSLLYRAHLGLTLVAGAHSEAREAAKELLEKNPKLQLKEKAKGLRDYCDMDASTKDLLKAAIAQFSLSGRGYDRTLKVSRTIANLEEIDSLALLHVAEAINYRAFNRELCDSYGERCENSARFAVSTNYTTARLAHHHFISAPLAK